MSPEEYSERLGELYGLISGDLALDTIVPAASDLLFEIKNRIVQEGMNTAGGEIGQYSQKPIYVTPQQFVNSGSLEARGKIGQGKQVLTVNVKRADKMANGRGFLPYLKERKGKNYTQLKNDFSDYKTMYLPGGYKELRDIQNLRTDIVNFKYRGDLINSYQMQKIGQYVVLGLTDEKSELKRAGLEQMFGLVFYATAHEVANYTSRVTFSINRLTRGILEGEGLQAVPTVEYV